MNDCTKESIKIANEEDYLDRLFEVYPIVNSQPRPLDQELVKRIQDNFQKDDKAFLDALLQLKRFPFKDSYVSFFRSYPKSILLNPLTTKRLLTICNELGLEKLLEMASTPKESNTQMGQHFFNWLSKNPLNCILHKDENEFIKETQNSILLLNDDKLKTFAKTHLNYNIEKGLDFCAKFSGKYIIGEAKFVTAEGGNQRNQLKTTRQLLDDTKIKAIKVAIVDGIVYLPKHKNLLDILTSTYNPNNVFSSLVLKDYLNAL